MLTPAQIAARYGNRARPAAAETAPERPASYEAVAQLIPDGPAKLERRRAPEEEVFERSVFGSRGAAHATERDPEAELHEYKAAAFAEVRSRRERMQSTRENSSANEPK